METIARPRAFILDKAVNYDFSALIGKWVPSKDNFVYLFSSNVEVGKYRPSVWNKKYQEEIIKRLTDEGFDPELDYFVVTGPFIPTTLACAVMGLMYDSFRMLQFSNAEASYCLIKVEYHNNGQ